MRSVFSLMACVCLFFQVNGCSGGNHSSSGFVKPTVTVIPASSSISTAQRLSVTVAVSGANGTQTGSVVLLSGSYTSFAATINSSSTTYGNPG